MGVEAKPLPAPSPRHVIMEIKKTGSLSAQLMPATSAALFKNKTLLHCHRTFIHSHILKRRACVLSIPFPTHASGFATVYLSSIPRMLYFWPLSFIVPFYLFCPRYSSSLCPVLIFSSLVIVYIHFILYFFLLFRVF